MNTAADLLIDTRATLGEGALWDAAAKRLYWVDIPAGRLHALTLVTGDTQSWELHEPLGAVALRESGGLLIARQSGFATLDPDSGTITPLIAPEEHLPDNRFNDGKCDPAGRFWAGTMSCSEGGAVGSLYRLDADGQAAQMVTDVTCSNGLAWSADGQTMYYVDTPTMRVDAFDFANDTGAIMNRRTVIEIPAGQGFPDGMTIDAAGNLWIAFWGGWQVGCWSPETGREILRVNVPVERVTCCTFGGDNLRTLFITTASEGIAADEADAQPHAGGVFHIQTDVAGTATVAYAG